MVTCFCGYYYRIRMQEAEASKKMAVDEAELRLESVYEGRMMELTTLQSKLCTIQGK